MRMRRFSGFAFLLVTALLLPVVPGSVQTATAQSAGIIVYSRYISATATREVRLVNTDGTNDQLITSGLWPRLSPDGNYVAFLRDGPYPPNYRNNLYVRNLQTGVETPVFTHSDYLVNYAWTNDSEKIVFDYWCQIWIMNRDGTNVAPLISEDCYDDAPSINPVDGRIAFHNLNIGLRLAYADGSGVMNIPNTLPGDLWPSWSADGQWIAFTRGANPSTLLGGNIFKIRPDGTSLTQLTFLRNDANNHVNPAPTWSPDECGLIAPATVNGVGNLYVISLNGDGTMTKIPTTFGAQADFVGSFLGNTACPGPPTADAGGPYLVAKGSSITLNGTGSDPNQDPMSFSWTATAGSFDDPTLEDPVYTAGDQAGIFELALTVTDPGNLSDSDTTMVVVYDPDGGFVTGGGWIESPEGAYPADPTLTGKATFGFVSKYKKGADVPTGETEFQFHVANLNFHSDSYEWLVVAGHKAMYKGVGTINGTGSYGFMLSAIDEELTPSTDVDLFRIKIWDRDADDVIVYDNQMGADDDSDPTTAIGDGNIVIHTAK